LTVLNCQEKKEHRLQTFFEVSTKVHRFPPSLTDAHKNGADVVHEGNKPVRFIPIRFEKANVNLGDSEEEVVGPILERVVIGDVESSSGLDLSFLNIIEA